ncbi:alpha-1,2-fucosyltransferase [Hoeflea ulvae]|uniref:Alpha-1,2-fucosyltransferase n=1 Tax=Hoeflea ulvae TaxID=2983764 RepID=A0ABT3YBV6_9HYPH|nr:alpha-1,2-fucosyltransferase [Hoeflea ulvae]MCY0093297.1 alpha-1,2-fucosyltransferase [Hoeflea ulvae]
MAMTRVISRLHGGLGNQLFQYAVGRAVALRTGAELLLDTRHYTAENPFKYDLEHFAIQARVASNDELPPAKNRPLSYAWWRKFGRSPRFVREQGLGYNERIASIDADCYLHGYFQSQRYFDDIAPTLWNDLSFREPISGENARMSERIQSGPSVSLHIRRGDYITNAKAQAAHGSTDLAYYQQALEEVRTRSGQDPVVYLFSNDPDWVRDNIKLDAELVPVAINDGATAHEDLRLMSLCDHNIIANSTFSWWGAWLNPSHNKIVAAPVQWFADPKLSNPDITPPGWLRL